MKFVCKCFVLISGFTLIVTPSAFAQFPDDVVETPADEVAIRQQFAGLHENNFYHWAFGTKANQFLQKGNSAVRDRMVATLSLSIDSIDRACRLTEEQRARLMLAGRGDIKRFMDDVDERKRFFDALKNDQSRINEISQGLQPLRKKFEDGIFGPGSLLRKSIKISLNSSQVHDYEVWVDQSKSFAYRARAEYAVLLLDQSIGLTAHQRTKFIELIMAETKPPRRSQNGTIDQQLILYQLARVPKAKLNAIIDNDQMAALEPMFEMAKRYEKTFIIQQMMPEGLEPLNEPIPVAPAQNRANLVVPIP